MLLKKETIIPIVFLLRLWLAIYVCTVIYIFLCMWYSGATCWLKATLTLYGGHLSIVDKPPGPTGVHHGQVLLYT